MVKFLWLTPCPSTFRGSLFDILWFKPPLQLPPASEKMPRQAVQWIGSLYERRDANLERYRRRG